jgi:hypothetical protein
MSAANPCRAADHVLHTYVVHLHHVLPAKGVR